MINYSFIIPHHNTPMLLQRLVDSIPQRDDVEVIVVDDNSDEDKKANIIRPDVRLIFIDKEHTRGAGHARNVGMSEGKGKWFLFADADDFYKPNFIEVLDEYKNDDIDILFFNVDTVDNDTLKPIKEYRSDFHQRQFKEFDGLQESIDKFLFWGYGPWRKMVSRRLVEKYGLFFEEIAVSNDSFFSLQTSYFAKKWKKDERVLYSLTKYKNSLTYSPVTKKKYSAYLYLFPKRREFFSFIGHSDWNKNSPKGRNSQSCLKYCYKLLRKSIATGVMATIYYLIHYRDIERKSDYYVNVIKEMELRNYDNE